MKYFFMSCCGVTVTARRARSSSSSSSSTVSSVREGRRTTTRSPARVSPTPRTTMSQTTSHRGSRSTAMSQARVSPTPSTVRQTARSEVEMSQRQQLPRRKCGRSGSSVVSAPSYSEWKPSLSSIAEDNISFSSGGRKGAVGNRTAGDERAVQRKEGGDWSRVHVRKYSADYGRASVATSIPAFNPTPFMF